MQTVFKYLMIWSLVLICVRSYGQESADRIRDAKVYRNLKRAIRNSNEVYSIDLSGKQMSSLSPEILKLKHLKVLNLSDNKFTEIPDVVFQLESLEELYLTSNSIDTIPKKISLLKNLRILFVGVNEISFVSPNISKLENLRRFDLDYNKQSIDIEFLRKALPNCLIKW